MTGLPVRETGRRPAFAGNYSSAPEEVCHGCGKLERGIAGRIRDRVESLAGLSFSASMFPDSTCWLMNAAATWLGVVDYGAVGSFRI